MNEPNSREALPSVLVVDDQPDVREALRLLLKTEGIASVGRDSPRAALGELQRRSYDCALVDLNYTRDTTSGEEGLELLERMRQQAPDMPLVAITAWGNVQLAVEAMQRGAADFIEKPWSNARLASVLRAQIALGAASRRQRRLEAENALLRGDMRGEMIAASPAMCRMLEVVGRIANTDANVLILGENGTGKGVLAKRLHALSLRAAGPFVKVNMGGIAENVFESEMFGHVRGAYTDARTERIGRFELAENGTLFLDEVANVPAAQQPKLLRVLDDGEFERLGSSQTRKADVRLISATNADLGVEVVEGRFRQDLLFRLNTFQIVVPPLRERREDIVPLARSFLADSAARYRRTQLRLSPSAERALREWHWPGNVRELQHVMARAALLADHAQVDAAVLNFGGGPVRVADLPEMTLEEMELQMVKRAMERYQGSLQRVAEMLGITRQSLYRRLERHGLRIPNDDVEVS